MPTPYEKFGNLPIWQGTLAAIYAPRAQLLNPYLEAPHPDTFHSPELICEAITISIPTTITGPNLRRISGLRASKVENRAPEHETRVVKSRNSITCHLNSKVKAHRSPVSAVRNRLHARFELSIGRASHSFTIKYS